MAVSRRITAPYILPKRNRLARAVIRPIFRGLFQILGRVQIIGLENIPASGSYLIAINHVSIFDPPFVIAFWPYVPEAIGAVEIWSKPGQSTLARLYGGIKVHRGEYDRQAMEKVLSALDAGRPLVIAPEGGRSHTPGLRKANPGVAYIAEKAGVPVVPVGVIGSTDDFLQQALRGKRPKILMKIGSPFTLPSVSGKGEQRRIARQKNADQIMYQIAALLPTDYQGIYRKPEN